MNVIIMNEEIKNRSYIFVTNTLDGKYIYLDNDHYINNKNELYVYLMFGNVLYKDNKKFNYNDNIEIEYSGIMTGKKYVNINDIYLDEKDLFIKEKLYIIMIVESNMKDTEKVIDMLGERIFANSNLMDVNNNKLYINNLSISDLIQINNVEYK